MFDYLNISNFRGLSSLKVSPLKQVNLFAGSNDVGKTAILEAICLLCGHKGKSGFPGVFRPAAENSIDAGYWYWLLPEKNPDLTAQIEIGYIKDGKQQLEYRTRLSMEPQSVPMTQRSIVTTYEKSGPANTIQGIGSWTGSPSGSGSGVGVLPHPTIASFSTKAIPPQQMAEDFNQVVQKRNGEKDMEARLRHVEERLTRLRYLRAESAPLVYADIGFETMIPVTQLGSPFYRLLTIFSGILAADAKIVLIDEIEGSLHYSTFVPIWKELIAVARQEKLQIFATTHSEECIHAAHVAYVESCDYNLAVHRVQRVKNKVEVVTHSREMLEAAFNSHIPIR